MEIEEELFFEIRDGSDKVRIDILGQSYPNAELDWDRRWLQSEITIVATPFSGKYSCELMVTDFISFQKELKDINENLNGFANFSTLEDQLELKIKGDGIGHFSIEGQANNGSVPRTALQFELTFDQTQLPDLIRQLERIIKAFPVKA